MTFYNLPDTPVTLEYTKNDQLLVVANLPEGYRVVHDPDAVNQVMVTWGDPDPREPTIVELPS